MSRSRVNLWRRYRVGWVGAVALFALAPKCLVCLAAYVGVGAFLGLRLAGPEICGGAPNAAPIGALLWLLTAAVVTGAVAVRRWSRHGAAGKS